MTELLDNNLLIKKFKELSEKNERGLICYVLPGSALDICPVPKVVIIARGSLIWCRIKS